MAVFDAYVDGLLSAAERAAFERRLEADPALRAEVELQRRIDARLRVAMAPPAMPEGEGKSADAASAPIPMRRVGMPAWLKVAAVLAVAAVGVWAAIARPWESWGPWLPSSLTADVVMKRMLDDGFTPTWKCENDTQFLQYSKDRLGVAFLVRPAASVQVLGWTYSPGLLAEPAQVLLVRAEGEPVMVAMGPTRDDREIRVEAGSRLHVQRGVYRGVVMYEISKLDHPVVVNAVVEK